VIRLATLIIAIPAAEIPAIPMLMTFAVAHVRQALQQMVAIGAFSPYLPAACATRPVHIVLMD
jgi:hypothetical protein